MKKIREYNENHPIVGQTMNLIRAINAQSMQVHGREMFDTTPRHNGSTFKTKHTKTGEEIEVRINATVPNDELFSLSQKFVEPKFEQFQMLNVFKQEAGYAPGSQAVGIDIITETGEAKITAAGQANPTVALSDINIGRRLQSVATLLAGITVTRQQLQTVNLRNDKGMGPALDWVARVMSTARRNVDRAHDDIIANGSHIEGLVAGNILGLKDVFSTNPALYDSNAPSKGKAASVAAGATSGKYTWFGKTAAEIIADWAGMAGYLGKKTLFTPKVMMLPPQLLIQRLALKTTTDLDTRPLIDWLLKAFKDTFKVDLNIVATNAMLAGSRSGTTRGNDWIDDTAACMLDNDEENYAIAIVEPLTLLPSVTDQFGTIRQVLTMSTGGLIAKQPAAGTILYGVQNGTAIS